MNILIYIFVILVISYVIYDKYLFQLKNIDSFINNDIEKRIQYYLNNKNNVYKINQKH